MRKSIALILALAIITALTGCGGQNAGKIRWYGLEEQQVVAGDEVNLLAGIRVTDSIDGDITANVVVLNDVDNAGELEKNGWLDDYQPFSSNFSGSYDVYYRATNSTGVTQYKKRIFTVRKSHNVLNGDFSEGRYSWAFDKPGGEASFKVNSDGNAEITIERAGTEWWALQLMQSVTFKKDVAYKATVIAKSPQQRSIAFSYEDANNGYKMLSGGIAPKKLETEFSEYNYYYTADKDYQVVKAALYLGHMLEGDEVTPDGGFHTVIVKSIKIEPIQVCGKVEFSGLTDKTLYSGEYALSGSASEGVEKMDLMEGVRAEVDGTDVTLSIRLISSLAAEIQGSAVYLIGYLIDRGDGVVAYAYRKISVSFRRENDYEPFNDDFKKGMASWTADVNQTAGSGAASIVPEITISEDVHCVKITVAKSSGDYWHIQMYQQRIKFEKGYTYTVSMRIKANDAVTCRMEAADANSDFAAISDKLTELGTEYQVYDMTISPSKNYGNVRVGVQCGKVPAGTIIIVDYIKITRA